MRGARRDAGAQALEAAANTTTQAEYDKALTKVFEHVMDAPPSPNIASSPAAELPFRFVEWDASVALLNKVLAVLAASAEVDSDNGRIVEGDSFRAVLEAISAPCMKLLLVDRLGGLKRQGAPHGLDDPDTVRMLIAIAARSDAWRDGQGATVATPRGRIALREGDLISRGVILPVGDHVGIELTLTTTDVFPAAARPSVTFNGVPLPLGEAEGSKGTWRLFHRIPAPGKPPRSGDYSTPTGVFTASALCIPGEGHAPCEMCGLDRAWQNQSGDLVILARSAIVLEDACVVRRHGLQPPGHPHPDGDPLDLLDDWGPWKPRLTEAGAAGPALVMRTG